MVAEVLTLVSVLISNSRDLAAIEVKLDNLASKVGKHNSMFEWAYRPERCMALLRIEVDSSPAKRQGKNPLLRELEIQHALGRL